MSVADRLNQLSASQYRVARVRMPDGRVARVKVPKDSTPEQAVAIARRVVPKEPQKRDGDFLASVKNVAGGFIEGLPPISLTTPLWEAATGTQRIINQGLGTVGSAVLRAGGLDDAAKWWERGAQGTEESLSRMPNPMTPTQKYLPQPPGTAATIARLGASMLGGAMAPKFLQLPRTQAPPKRASFPGPRTAKEVPTIPQLKQQADDLYTRAEANGVTASKEQTGQLANQFRQIATENGLITPKGRVLTGSPKVRDALDLMDDFSEGTMTPTQMKSVRKVLSDATGSLDKSERRVAKIMLGAFDDWTAPLAPEFAEARQVARRYLSAQTIDDAIEAANTKTSQFSNSGLENSLRTTFRQLDNRIIKGKEPGLIPEVVEAVQNVSRGTRGSNLARDIGKLAPTSPMSIGLGAGVPFGVGNAIGGPGLGGAFSAMSTGAGILGRATATRMAQKNAELASLIARNGGKIAEPASLGIDSLMTPATQRGLLAVSPRAGSLLAEDLFLPLAADDDRERKKKKKKR